MSKGRCGLALLALITYVCPTESAEFDTCETVAEWRQPTHAHNVDDQVVEVVQDIGPQVFYSVRCNSTQEGNSCSGIQAGMQSRCETRYNLVMALVYSDSDSERPKRVGLNKFVESLGGQAPARPTKWAMIKLPGQCVCSLRGVSTATLPVFY